MKNRKVFLDGYVELKRDYFKGGRTKESFVVINPQVGFIGVSVGCLELAKVNAPAANLSMLVLGFITPKINSLSCLMTMAILKQEELATQCFASTAWVQLES